MSRSIYCRRCRYNLHKLREPVCSECGLGFDPRRPRTYLSSPEAGLPYEVKYVFWLQGGMIGSLVLLYVLFALTRSVL